MLAGDGDEVGRLPHPRDVLGEDPHRRRRYLTGCDFEVPVEELEDDLDALHPVLGRPGAGQLVALAGEADELDVAAEQPQRDEQLLGLGDRAAQVVLGVQDQQRRRDVVDVGDRRLAPVLARDRRGG